MEFKEHDFVKIEFDIYANGKLESTTNQEKSKENNVGLEKDKFLILGENKILKALDQDILNNYKKENETKTLELTPKQAFGERNKEKVQTLNINAFKKHNIKPVVGGVYNFDGNLAVVKSVSGGRILVDFNNPLAGKDIKIDYKITQNINEENKKLETYFKEILKFPETSYNIKDKKVYVNSALIEYKTILEKDLHKHISKDIQILAQKEKEEKKTKEDPKK